MPSLFPELSPPASDALKKTVQTKQETLLMELLLARSLSSLLVKISLGITTRRGGVHKFVEREGGRGVSVDPIASTCLRQQPLSGLSL